MSQCRVVVIPVDELFPHDNADSLSIIKYLGWEMVVKSADWVDENNNLKYNKAVYIPIDAVIKPHIALKLGYDPDKVKRVKPIKLRGRISQGLVFPTDVLPELSLEIGDDITEYLEVVDYEDPSLQVGIGRTSTWPGQVPKYDIERIQNFPTIFQIGEMVEATTKLHGTNSGFMVHHNNVYDDWQFTAMSRNNAYNVYAEGNDDNLWVKYARKHELDKWMLDYIEYHGKHITSLLIRGELIGPGLLGNNYAKKEVELRVFDIMVNGVYVGVDKCIEICHAMNLERVTQVYYGPFFIEKDFHGEIDDETVNFFKEYGEGPDIENPNTLREGIVIRPLNEQDDYKLGRKILKYVNPMWGIKNKD